MPGTPDPAAGTPSLSRADDKPTIPRGDPGNETRNVTVCNKCPRMSLIMTLIPGCDLEHSQGTLTLGVGT